MPSREDLIRELEVKRERTRRNQIRLLQDSFPAFVQWAWHILEPGRELKWNWSVELICRFLMAFAYRKFHRGIINIPPRGMKSTLVSVCYPVWVWIQDRERLAETDEHAAKFVGNWHQFLCLANDSPLALRDAVQARNLMEHNEFIDLFGDIVNIPQGQNEKSYYRNTANGHRNSRPIQGSLTGKGGDTILCFPYYEEVHTESCLMTIGDMVKEKTKCRVKSFNTETGDFEWKEVTGWQENPGRDIYRVKMSDGTTMTCTADHRVWTSNRGWVEAIELLASDMIPQVPINPLVLDVENQLRANTKLFRKFSVRFGRIVDQANLWIGKFFASTFPIVRLNQVFRVLSPSSTASYLGNNSVANPVTRSKNTRCVVADSDLPGDIRIDDCSRSVNSDRECSMLFRVFDVLRSSSISKIAWNIILWIPIKMSDVMARWPGSYERCSNASMGIEGRSLLHHPGVRSKIPFSIVNKGEHFSFVSDYLSAGLGDSSRLAAKSPKIGNTVQSLETNDRSPVLIEYAGHVDRTYCLTVDGNHTFVAGSGEGIIVANCDDPHDAEKAMSDADRMNVIDSYTGKVTSRLNDQRDGGILIIMQRLHEADLAGVVREKDGDWGPRNKMGWVSLVLPMQYELDDPKKKPMNPAKLIGFPDPRTKKGELLWPERFPLDSVMRLRSDLERTSGVYGATAQLQQTPAPSEGGILRKSWWRRWPDDKSFPLCEHIFLSWDTAYTEQDLKNASFSARTAWGVFWNEQDQAYQLILLHCWAEQFAYPDLRQKAQDDTLEFLPDAHLIEKKASGQSLIQDLRRAGRGRKRVRLRTYSPDRDKVSRAHAVTSPLSSGLVWAPNRHWADKAIDACGVFPNGAPPSADITDTVTQAILYLKQGWWIEHPDDVDEKSQVGGDDPNWDTEDDENQRSSYGGYYG